MIWNHIHVELEYALKLPPNHTAATDYIRGMRMVWSLSIILICSYTIFLYVPYEDITTESHHFCILVS